MTLDGGVATNAEGSALEARLDIHRIDQETASVDLGASLDLVSETIGLDLVAKETGGLLARVSQQPDAGDFHLDLHGDGPLSDWRARLDLVVERLIETKAELGLAYSDTPAVELVAELVPAEGALPADIAELLGERLDVNLSAGQRAPGVLALDALRLRSALVTVDGQATASLEEDRVDGGIALSIADLSRASGVAGTPLAGSIDVAIDALGTFTEPALRLTIDGRAVKAADLGIGEIASRFDIALLAPLDAGFAGVDVTGGIELADLEQAGEPLRPEEALNLELDAHVPMEGQAELRRLAVRGEHVQLDGTATIAMPDLEGEAHLRGDVESLASLIDALGPMVPPDLALVGAASLDVTADIGKGAETIGVDVKLLTEALSGLPSGADSVVGTSPSLVAHLDIEQGRALQVSGLVLDAAALGLDGEVSLGLDAAQALAGQLRLAIPALAALEPLAQQPLAGSSKVTVDLAGSIGAPQIAAKALVDALEVAGQSFDRIGLDATVAGPPDALDGTVSLEVEQFGETLALDSGYALRGEKLGLKDLSLRGPETDLAGALDIDLGSLLASGSLSGRLNDLAALRPWHNQALAGVVALDVRLAAEGGRQNARATIEVPNLEGDFGVVDALKLEADISDALGKLGIDADLDLGGFSQPGLQITSANVGVTGDLAMLTVEAKAKGRQDTGELDVAATARLDVMGERRQVFVDALNAEVAGQKIELRSPSVLVLDKGVLDIDQLDLRVGEAQIQGKATMGDGRIQAGIDLGRMPLAALAAFGAPDMTGTLEGRLVIEGPTSAPEVSLDLDVAEIRPGDPYFAKKPSFDAQITAGLARGRVEARVELEGMADKPGVITVALPAQLSLEPFVFDLDPGAPLDGNADARLDLGRLSALAPLDGQVIEGMVVTAIDIGGRLDDPLLNGTIELERGHFQDSASGLVLLDLGMLIRARGHALEIERLAARDDEGGEIGLSGDLDIDPNGRFPFDMRLSSKSMRLLDSELGRAYVTTALEVSGDARGGAAKGKITVDRADLLIPSGGGIDPVVLDVREVGDGASPAVAQPAKKSSSGGFVVDLNIDVDVPSKLFVRGRGLDSEWGGKLKVRGSSAAPEIAGSIDFRRGFLDFLDRRFDIRRGSITFVGGVLPEIDLEASAQGETLLAIIAISGPATAPEFELRSEPAGPQDEVLADLLFKRDVSSITPAQGIRLAAAIRTLEGGGVDTLGQLRNATGLDTLDVGGASAGEATAKAGKYLADGVFLEVERGLASGSGKARVEIELTDNITVNTEVSEDAQGGVGIEWRLDY